MIRHDLTTTDRLLLRPNEAAASLGVSLRTLMEWVAADAVPHVRLGKQPGKATSARGSRRRQAGSCLRFSPEALRAWIAFRSNTDPAAGQAASHLPEPKNP